MTNTLNKIIHNGDEYELLGGEVGVSDQANNIFTPGMKIWGGTETDYQSLTPDSNTAYLLLAGGPTPGGWQPGVNTKVYYKINDNDTNSTIYDLSGNGVDQTWSGTPGYATDATYGRVANFNSNNYTQHGSIIDFGQEVTYITLIKPTSNAKAVVMQCGSSSSWPFGMWLESGQFTMGTISFGAINFGSTSGIITSNQRVMLSATVSVSNGTVKLYKNGVLDKTYTGQTGSINYNTGGNNLGIGIWRSGDSSRFDGDFKLFIGENRCWTDQEIADLASEYGF